MAGIRITWTDPTTRVDGSPLQAEDIGGIEVSMKVSGAPDFTLVATVEAGVMQLDQTDLPAGGYSFQIEVFDKQSPPHYSGPVVVAQNIMLAAPSPVTGAAAVLIP
jgi:hypothetical protein